METIDSHTILRSSQHSGLRSSYRGIATNLPQVSQPGEWGKLAGRITLHPRKAAFEGNCPKWGDLGVVIFYLVGS